MKEESKKVGLKLNIQKTKIMASGPITSWEIDGETVKTVSDFILGSFEITADGDCSHEIKRCLFLDFSLVAQTVKRLPNAGDLGSVRGSGRSPGEGNSNPFQYSCLENPTEGGAW